MSLGAWSKPNNNDRRLDPIPSMTRPLFIPPPPPLTPKATPLQKAPTTIVLPTRTDIVATTTTLPKPHAAGDEAEDFLAEEGVDLTINISGVMGPLVRIRSSSVEAKNSEQKRCINYPRI